MSAVVDFTYYSTVYMGTEVTAETSASFPALCARASDIVGAMTRWVDPATLDAWTLNLYKKAICAQVDFFAVNGLEAVAGGDDLGWTVGKVSVSGKSGSDLKAMGVMAENLSPMVQLYLEQTGLMYPGVPVVGGLV